MDREEQIGGQGAKLINTTTPALHRDNILRGVVYGCIAMFLFTVQGAIVKFLATNHNVIEIAFYRNLVAAITVIIFILATRRTHLLKTGRPMLLFSRVLAGAIGLVATFYAFALLPLADATTIIMTNVLMIPALSFFFLAEHIGRHRWSAIILGLVGVMLMVHPSGHVEMIGVLVAFSAAFLQSIIQVFLRMLKSESSLTVTLYLTLGGALLCGLFMPFIARMPTPEEFGLLLLIGVGGGVAQYCLTSAFRLAPASIVAPLNYTGLIWAALIDIYFWNIIPGISVFAGAAVIIASQTYIVHREKLAEKHSLSSPASEA